MDSSGSGQRPVSGPIKTVRNFQVSLTGGNLRSSLATTGIQERMSCLSVSGLGHRHTNALFRNIRTYKRHIT